MHTPGPWHSVRFETGEYYTHEISAAGGHIASVVGWTSFGSTCPTTEANARLIAHAPDLVTALQSLIAWADTMGGWEAACWERARSALVSAFGGECYEHQRPKSERSDSPRLPRSQRHNIRLLRRD
jgi:hypothetical protein